MSPITDADQRANEYFITEFRQRGWRILDAGPVGRPHEQAARIRNYKQTRAQLIASRELVVETSINHLQDSQHQLTPANCQLYLDTETTHEVLNGIPQLHLSLHILIWLV